MLGKERDSLFYAETTGLVNTAVLGQQRSITRNMQRILEESPLSGWCHYAKIVIENNINSHFEFKQADKDLLKIK